MRIVSGLMVLLLAWVIFLQFNDPDGWLWVIIYAYPLVLSLLVALGKKLRNFHFIGAVAFLLAFIPYLFFVESFSLDNEKYREAGGLLICSLWLFCTHLWIKKTSA